MYWGRKDISILARLGAKCCNTNLTEKSVALWWYNGMKVMRATKRFPIELRSAPQEGISSWYCKPGQKPTSCRPFQGHLRPSFFDMYMLLKCLLYVYAHNSAAPILHKGRLFLQWATIQTRNLLTYWEKVADGRSSTEETSVSLPPPLRLREQLPKRGRKNIYARGGEGCCGMVSSWDCMALHSQTQWCCGTCARSSQRAQSTFQG